MAPRGLSVLSRLERRIVVGVVLAGVLLLAGAIWAVLNRERVEVWLTGDEVAAAHRAAMTTPLPAGLEDDPTLSACQTWMAVRCAWSDETPEAAARLLSDALTDAGLDVGAVVCGDQLALESIGSPDAVCAAAVPVARERLWVVTTDRTPEGAVPLTRTAAWLVWDEDRLSWPMIERINQEWFGTAPPTIPEPPSPQEVAQELPGRLVPLIDGECLPGGGVCTAWTGPVDLSDLGDDPVAGLVAELTRAGYFVDAAEPERPDVQAHRFFDAGSRQGLTVSVREVDGEIVAEVFVL